MADAIKAVDPTRRVTLGDMAYSSAGAPGLQCTTADGLDYYSLHPEPQDTAAVKSVEELRKFWAGLIAGLPDDGAPVVIEELYPDPGAPGNNGWLGPDGLGGELELLRAYVAATSPRAVGWMAFYWGDAESLNLGPADAATYRRWLDQFARSRPAMHADSMPPAS